MQIHDFEQGSFEWHQVRCGIPTASAMKQLFTGSHGIPKNVTGTMLTYAAELAADLQSGLPLSMEEGFQGNAITERGHELEPIAADEYAFATDTDPQKVGFITNHGAGCSPDRLIGENGLLEIKCLLAKAHTKAVADCVSGTCPADYYVQCMAQMWITGRQWCDLHLYHPHLPSYTFRVEADPEFFKKLEQQVAVILAERDRLVSALEAA